MSFIMTRQNHWKCYLFVAGLLRVSANMIPRIEPSFYNIVPPVDIQINLRVTEDL